MTPLAGGYHNQVYLCENGPSDLPDKLVVRVPTCPEAARAAEVSATQLEGLPAPQTLHIGRLAISNTPIFLEEYVEGEQRPLDALNLGEIGELANRLAFIHSHTSSRFSDTSGSTPTRSGTYGDYLKAMVTESVTHKLKTLDMTAHVGAHRAIASGIGKLYDLLEANSKAFSACTFSLLHHDLNPGNMLWDSNDLVTFIDWNPTFGDPADDVDYLATNNDVGDDFRRIFLNLYCSATECSDIIDRLNAYTLKNQLDDLAWIIDMRRRFVEDPRYNDNAYEQRLTALRTTLDQT